MRDGKGYGRIYRITPEGTHAEDAGARPAHDRRSGAGAAQSSGQRPQQRIRAAEGQARRSAAGSAGRSSTIPTRIHRARAVWLMAHLGPDGVKAVEQQLADPDAQLRLAAFRALRQVKTSVIADARRLSTDASPAVRREVALALRGVPFHESRDLLMALAAGYDGTRSLVSRGARHGRVWRRGRFLFDVTDVSRRIPIRSPGTHASRPSPGACIPPRRSAPSRHGRRHSRLTVDARRQALVALGFVNHPRAAQAMADLTRSGLPDVAAQAAWWMTYRKTNDWREPCCGADGSPPCRRRKASRARHDAGLRAASTRRRGTDRPPHRGHTDDGPRRRPAGSCSFSSRPRTRSPDRYARLPDRSSLPIPTAASDRPPPATSPAPEANCP